MLNKSNHERLLYAFKDCLLLINLKLDPLLKLFVYVRSFRALIIGKRFFAPTNFEFFFQWIFDIQEMVALLENGKHRDSCLNVLV